MAFFLKKNKNFVSDIDKVLRSLGFKKSISQKQELKKFDDIDDINDKM